jgi:hypothetical protein
MKITRTQLIAEIARRQPNSRPTGNSFASRGAKQTWDRAMKLLGALERGEVPTTPQVVGYFGKGARFEDK